VSLRFTLEMKFTSGPSSGRLMVLGVVGIALTFGLGERCCQRKEEVKPKSISFTSCKSPSALERICPLVVSDGKTSDLSGMRIAETFGLMGRVMFCTRG
jgi:hypothetical protein